MRQTRLLEIPMRKLLYTLAALFAFVAVAIAVAVRVGAPPIVSACVGAEPTGAFRTYRATAGDGNCLQGYAWAPASEPRAAVVVVHGLHDHARRYEPVARTLGAAGVGVVAQDHRGHGGSGGARQRLDSVEQLIGDVAVAVQEARRRWPGVPVFVHGHSLGGMVVAQFVAREGGGLAGAVISSAALKLPPGVSAGQVRVVSTLSAIAPSLGLEALDAAKVVRDPAAQAALVADPLLGRDKLPARTVATLLAGIVDLQPKMGSIKLPLLILHGEADTVTDPAGARALLERAASTDKTLRTFGPALHDLLHEPEAAEVTREIVAFVSARIAPGPRVAAEPSNRPQ